ncbi:hypothetical protein SAMN05216298_4062 [Glycomyces sambucus]|uniref:Uncharacterized protein n=1 Tax=Glycomyces sambucus TaxID=380244 RepID=A0A1G9KH33_9ACTN|nr:hypothetical protein [Glycomyces sambucus]SDL49148.1 hypothetical protein SAMN05216298_4062 [Glycomyces sambucus]
MPDSPRSAALPAARKLAIPLLFVAWLVALYLLFSDAMMACAYPDPPPGGCPADEVEAGARFDLWILPVLAAGPVVLLAVRAALSPEGKRYRAVWVLCCVVWFCVAPAFMIDAAVTGFGAFDGPERYAEEASRASDWKFAVFAVTATAPPAALAFLVWRRGERGFALGLAGIAALTLVFLFWSAIPVL